MEHRKESPSGVAFASPYVSTYLENADRCEALSQSANNAVHQEEYMKLAAEWRALAAEVRRG